MAGRLLVGTQGWNHPGWTGSLYPHGTKALDCLSLYARAFPTVEVDSTFHAIPAEPVVAAWREHTPPEFVFALKVPQEITHEKRLVGVEQRLARFLHRVKGLEGRLGPLLMQLSPDFRATDATRGKNSAECAADTKGPRSVVSSNWLPMRYSGLSEVIGS